FSAEASERRRLRRAANPRSSFVYVLTVLGLALVTGAVVGLLADDAVAVALGLLVGALVLACGMVIAGIARRRSGFLAFVTVLTLIGGAIAGGVATAGDVALGSRGISNGSAVTLQQPFGDLSIYLMPLDESASHPIVVDKGRGYTQIDVQPGVQLDLRATLGDGSVRWSRINTDTGEWIEDGTWSGDGGLLTQSVPASPNPDDPDAPPTVQPVTITQASGDIQVTFYVRSEEKSE
ncbi:MAG: hypothetical protein WA971_02065, partial [Microbacterium sp.]